MPERSGTSSCASPGATYHALLGASACLVVGLAVLLGGCEQAETPARAQEALRPAANSTARPDTVRFDLIVYGRGLADADLSVALKTNPDRGARWTPLGAPQATAASANATGSVAVWARRSAGRFLGQDLRARRLLLRIRPPDGVSARSAPAVRAVYAVPSLPDRSPDAAYATRLLRQIVTDPLAVRRLSYASLVRPRPLALADTTLTTPVEAPVRHLKPGVLEVRWLDLLYRTP
jgi:hypothetical protein